MTALFSLSPRSLDVATRNFAIDPEAARVLKNFLAGKRLETAALEDCFECVKLTQRGVLATSDDTMIRAESLGGVHSVECYTSHPEAWKA